MDKKRVEIVQLVERRRKWPAEEKARAKPESASVPWQRGLRDRSPWRGSRPRTRPHGGDHDDTAATSGGGCCRRREGDEPPPLLTRPFEVSKRHT